MNEVNANKAAIGRYWGSANEARLTQWPEGDTSVVLTWNDGARISFDCATHSEAVTMLERYGFVIKIVTEIT